MPLIESTMNDEITNVKRVTRRMRWFSSTSRGRTFFVSSLLLLPLFLSFSTASLYKSISTHWNSLTVSAGGGEIYVIIAHVHFILPVASVGRNVIMWNLGVTHWINKCSLIVSCTYDTRLRIESRSAIITSAVGDSWLINTMCWGERGWNKEQDKQSMQYREREAGREKEKRKSLPLASVGDGDTHASSVSINLLFRCGSRTRFISSEWTCIQ